MNHKNTEIRKQLEKRIETLNIEYDAKREEVSRIEKGLDHLAGEINRLKRNLEELKPKAVRVSDHAVLRYLERKAGIDVEAIRKSILESDLPAMVGALGGSGKFPINGYQVVLKDYTVVTIN